MTERTRFGFPWFTSSSDRHNQMKPELSPIPIRFKAKFYSCGGLHSVLRWVLGGGVGVPCTVNPLYDGPKAGAEALKAAEAFIPEAKTIRPLGLAVFRRLS